MAPCWAGRCRAFCARPTRRRQSWPHALGRTTTLGFDTLLIPGPVPGADVPASLIEAANGLNVAVLADVSLDHVPAALLDGDPGPFLRPVAPTTDPRAPPAPAPDAVAAIGIDGGCEGARGVVGAPAAGAGPARRVRRTLAGARRFAGLGGADGAGRDPRRLRRSDPVRLDARPGLAGAAGDLRRARST